MLISSTDLLCQDIVIPLAAVTDDASFLQPFAAILERLTDILIDCAFLNLSQQLDTVSD